MTKHTSRPVIHDKLPPGLTLAKNAFGTAIFATQPFAKGSLVYIGKFCPIEDKDQEFELVTDCGTYVLDSATHSVKDGANSRQLYLFDSFMNHSCEATTISSQTQEDKDNNRYKTIALRDIKPGDEITCDYTLFEYDCTDKRIDKCLCGAKTCLGRVYGFSDLSMENKKSRVQLIDEYIVEMFAAAHPNDVLYLPDLQVPEGIAVEKIEGGHRLVATRPFKAGEVFFTNVSRYVPENMNIIVKILGERIWLEPLRHTVNRGDGMREFFGFDTFMNHSCDPNGSMQYKDKTHYSFTCTRDVPAGGEITCDYETFDTTLDNQHFECDCGASNCRGKVVS